MNKNNRNLQRRSFLLLSHTSRTQTVRSNSLNQTKNTLKALKHIELYCFTHFWTLEHTLNHKWTPELWKICVGDNCLLFFYLYLPRAAVFSIEQLFSHFEFQILNKPCLIQRNTLLGDHNTYHICIQIVNKLLFSSFLKSYCFITVFR